MRLKSLDHVHPRPSRPSRPWPPNPRIQATRAAGTPSGLRLSPCACGPRRLVASLPPAESRAMSCGEDRMTKLSRHWRTQSGVLSRPVPPNKGREACRQAETQRRRDADAAWHSSWRRWVWCIPMHNRPLAASRVAGLERVAVVAASGASQ
jgi:hypothetical protein